MTMSLLSAFLFVFSSLALAGTDDEEGFAEEEQELVQIAVESLRAQQRNPHPMSLSPSLGLKLLGECHSPRLGARGFPPLPDIQHAAPPVIINRSSLVSELNGLLVLRIIDKPQAPWDWKYTGAPAYHAPLAVAELPGNNPVAPSTPTATSRRFDSPVSVSTPPYSHYSPGVYAVAPATPRVGQSHFFDQTPTAQTSNFVGTPTSATLADAATSSSTVFGFYVAKPAWNTYLERYFGGVEAPLDALGRKPAAVNNSAIASSKASAFQAYRSGRNGEFQRLKVMDARQTIAFLDWDGDPHGNSQTNTLSHTRISKRCELPDF